MPSVRPQAEDLAPLIRVINKDGTQLTPGLRGALDSKASGFTIATATTDYNIRINLSDYYFTTNLRNVWYPKANAYYRTAYGGQIGFNQTITIKFSYIDDAGSEIDTPGITLDTSKSPWTFPANSLATNIKISNSSGSTVTINPLWLQ